MRKASGDAWPGLPPKYLPWALCLQEMKEQGEISDSGLKEHADKKKKERRGQGMSYKYPKPDTH